MSVVSFCERCELVDRLFSQCSPLSYLAVWPVWYEKGLESPLKSLYTVNVQTLLYTRIDNCMLDQWIIYC